MARDTETLDVPSQRARGSLLPADAGLLLMASEGDAAIARITRLPPGPLLIGRDPPAGGLAIPQGAVSRLHARIGVGALGAELIDLDSRNGVIVNGRKVARRVLEHGDHIHVGNALFKFLESGCTGYESPAPSPAGFESVVAGPALACAIADLAVVAKTDLSVVILGQTGTGKEVFADAVHRASLRKGRFVALNCAAIPAGLLEAELFGVKKGAFTGADRDREGLVRAADRGTLFLDEIGDMPLDAQAKMLRFIESHEVLPLGATVPERSEARLLCATHRDLEELVSAGRFRADLLARIRQHTVRLPPLADRREDLGILTNWFLRLEKRADASFDFRAQLTMHHYRWPYNVRELSAAIRRAVALSRTAKMGERELPDDVRECMKGYGSPEEANDLPGEAGVGRGAEPTADELRTALRQFDGNVAAVARHFGKDRTQVHRWMRRYGIAPDSFRS